MDIIRFVKNWTLPISMVTGALSYFIYASIPALDFTHPFVSEFTSIIQPVLIFCMLFLAFCKIAPHELRPHWWQFWLLLIQMGLFCALSGVLCLFPDTSYRLILEGAMLSILCPTATACAVVTMKLGGNAAATTTYTMAVNLAVAVLAPLMLPLAHPQEGIAFLPAFFIIIRKVFPLLFCPLLAAWLVRYCFPSLHKKCLAQKDLAFYLWAIALAIAIAVTCKAIMHSSEPVLQILGIAVVSLFCCIFQFAVGKWVGTQYGCRIEGGQALGQKNTVFIIWLGYTFLTPVTAVAGGFYSVWHNLINTYQLYKKRKQDEALVK
ncbi:MAG: transporter [Bacteroidaceae bacterium]|nr:transporter [Bacteroidaceae bacterium]